MKTKALIKTGLSLTFISLALFSIFVSHKPFCSASSSSGIIIVQPGQSIIEAINNAHDGDTIFVKSGVYTESKIIVNKTVTLMGESAQGTVVDGGGTAQYVFYISASNVVIDNFTLQNTNPVTFSPAIWIFNVTNVTVKNVVTQNVFYGLQVESSNFTKIMNCEFSQSFNSGIYLKLGSCNNTFVGNTIENNPNGVWIAQATCQFNRFYHNNLRNNTKSQILTVGGVNYFDNGYPSGGNYFSDHSATDLKYGTDQNETGSDGIFDEGYPADSSVHYDNYPLVNPLTGFNVEEQAFFVEVSTNVTVTACNFNSSDQSLNLFVNGSLGAVGTCRVIVPKGLLSSENLSKWVINVYSDGDLQTPSFMALEDEENTYLYFVYNQAEKSVIKFVIPEFSTLLMILALMATTLMVMAFKNLRHDFNS